MCGGLTREHNNGRCMFLSTYYVPGPVLGTLTYRTSLHSHIKRSRQAVTLLSHGGQMEKLRFKEVSVTYSRPHSG